MHKYILTIVDLKTGTVQNLVRESTLELNKTVDKELGGWSNLRTASTSTKELDQENYQIAGTTKDDKSMFSILYYSTKS